MLIVKNDALKRFLRDLAHDMNPMGGKIFLFGSYKTGQHRPDSDVDLLLILDKKYHPQITDKLNTFFLQTSILISSIILTVPFFMDII